MGPPRGRNAARGDVDDLIVELHRVDAGAGGDRQVAQLEHRRLLVVQHEAFGDEQAESRYFSIVLLKRLAERGDIAPLHAATRTVAGAL